MIAPGRRSSCNIVAGGGGFLQDYPGRWEEIWGSRSNRNPKRERGRSVIAARPRSRFGLRWSPEVANMQRISPTKLTAGVAGLLVLVTFIPAGLYWFHLEGQRR